MRLQKNSFSFAPFETLFFPFAFLVYCHLSLLSVSHTTDDMIFQWDPSVPLVVDSNIELPQLALVENHTADCKLKENEDFFPLF